mgnify:FL=1
MPPQRRSAARNICSLPGKGNLDQDAPVATVTEGSHAAPGVLPAILTKKPAGGAAQQPTR